MVITVKYLVLSEGPKGPHHHYWYQDDGRERTVEQAMALRTTDPITNKLFGPFRSQKERRTRNWCCWARIALLKMGHQAGACSDDRNVWRARTKSPT